MDIIVTTPKTEIANARKEAQDCISNGGGYYFRRLHSRPDIKSGERIFYVEDGFIRGFALCERLIDSSTKEGRDQLIEMGLEIIPECETTGRQFGHGLYAFMPADSWTWISPIPMKGFQGWRYARPSRFNSYLTVNGLNYELKTVGNWLSPKP